MSKELLQRFRQEVSRELNRILFFWLHHSIDQMNGGFIGEMDGNGEIILNADKSLVLNTRILWTFSMAYRIYGKNEYLQAAKRAYHFLNDHFTDPIFGGMYWSVDRSCRPSENKKQVYGQAFAIYAYCEYYHATQEEDAVKRAIDIFTLLEKYARDRERGGYFEAFGRDWRRIDEVSLSNKDLNEQKSMNTHLHLLEAYTQLYSCYSNNVVKDRLHELIEVTLDRIVDPESYHFLLFFDENWKQKSEMISYGHDIEGSWLLVEAAERLGDPVLLKRTKKTAVKMAYATLEQGVDQDGGLVNEAGPQGWTDMTKDWWPQAEAVVGFVNAFQLSEDERFLKAAHLVWAFIQCSIVDRKNGEWFWKVSRGGEADWCLPKISAWKCPYHNARGCVETMKRLDDILKLKKE